MYSPTLNGSSGLSKSSSINLDVDISGAEESVPASSNTAAAVSEVPSSYRIPVNSSLDDRTMISDSRYSKYDCRNNSNTGASSLIYSGRRLGSRVDNLSTMCFSCAIYESYLVLYTSYC